jgi:hypothetical protein
LNCSKCGFDNKADALFCKKCGADLTRQQSIINRLNGQINLLSVFIGLIFSIIILFIGALLFSGIITSGSSYIPIYIGIILVAMAFFGSIVASILGSRNSNEGYTNGFFLSLVILVFGGFILGILLFVVVGILASLANALGSFSSLAPANTTDSTGFIYGWLNLIEGIGIIILVFLFGGMGGGIGYYMKNL